MLCKAFKVDYFDVVHELCASYSLNIRNVDKDAAQIITSCQILHLSNCPENMQHGSTVCKINNQSSDVCVLHVEDRLLNDA